MEPPKPEPCDLVPLNPIKVFDAARTVFFTASSQMLRAEEMAGRDKAMEVESTIRVLRQMARLEGLNIDA